MESGRRVHISGSGVSGGVLGGIHDKQERSCWRAGPDVVSHRTNSLGPGSLSDGLPLCCHMHRIDGRDGMVYLGSTPNK